MLCLSCSVRMALKLMRMNCSWHMLGKHYSWRMVKPGPVRPPQLMECHECDILTYSKFGHPFGLVPNFFVAYVNKNVAIFFLISNRYSCDILIKFRLINHKVKLSESVCQTIRIFDLSKLCCNPKLVVVPWPVIGCPKVVYHRWDDPSAYGTNPMTSRRTAQLPAEDWPLWPIRFEDWSPAIPIDVLRVRISAGCGVALCF